MLQALISIRVGDHDLAVQCFRVTTVRDTMTPDIAAMVEPEAESAWPLTPARVAELAAIKLRDSGARPDRRDDCLWALKQSTLAACASHYWLEARSDAERRTAHGTARRAAATGEKE
jgi:hypothetical protein